jgi:hypothetical protein
MRIRVDAAVELLRADYAAVRGRPFRNFYCPILFRDEAVNLRMGHVINEAFGASDRHTTVQRTDIDNFFGSVFEADFALFAAQGDRAAVDVLADRRLSRKLRPRILIDGRPVDHYLPAGTVPSTHSEMSIERHGGAPVRLAIKVEPSDTLTASHRNLEIRIQRDVRLPALVSLLKAAHLSLFRLIGYRYALAASGHFMGWHVLGRYAAENMTLDRSAALANAHRHFLQFVNLVRPMAAMPADLQGTISDGKLFLCKGTPKAWAFMVFVRTGNQMHAVLVPVLEDAESADRFVRFLSRPAPRIEATLMRFAGDRWEAGNDVRVIDWPAADFDDGPATVSRR